ncbi:MAG: hypothetical protein GXP45_05620 [bacterium]|nr:hypothetical protein [bacterium]
MKGDWSFSRIWDKLKGLFSKKDDNLEDGDTVNNVIDDEEKAKESYEDFMKDPKNAEKIKYYESFGSAVNNFSDSIYKFNDGSLNKTQYLTNL